MANGLALAAAFLCIVAFSPSALATSPGPPRGAAHHARLAHACPPPQPGTFTCFAVSRQATSDAGGPAAPTSTPAEPSLAPTGPAVEPANPAGTSAKPSDTAPAYTPGAGALAFGPAEGLTPALLASAYDYDPRGGAGQTVAVVDAYDDPKIEGDLAIFDQHYGLGECTQANGCFTKVNQEGGAGMQTLPAKDKIGWSQETSLDVDTVRAACQECRILLVETNDDSDLDLAKGVDEAVALGATEVSNSYGGPESNLGPVERDAYDHPGVVITAAAGDYGWDDWNFTLDQRVAPGVPNAPASLPSVVSVGGTSLRLREDGTRAGESVWNDDGPANAQEAPAGYVDGGGCSTRFAADPWQLDAPGFSAGGCGEMRLATDVSAVGDPLTGLDIVDTYDYCGKGPQCSQLAEQLEAHDGWQTFGGTSLSAPLIASLYALAGGGAGLSYSALTLYGHIGDSASLYDVSEGGNGFCDGEPQPVCGEPDSELGATLDCEATTACDAAPGYDGPTGVGTPNGLKAFEPALPTAVASAPTSLLAGTPAGFSPGASSDPYPGASITSWAWDWGDGSPESHEADPAHTYAAAGQYTVSLIVTDSYGLSSAAGKIVVQVKETTTQGKKTEPEKGEEPQQRTSGEQQEQPAGSTPQSEGTGNIAAFQTRSPAAVPDAQLLATALVADPAATVVLRVSCPAGESSCAGTVTLCTLSAFTVTSTRTRRRRRIAVTVGACRFAIAGGRSATCDVRLSAVARELLAHVHELRVAATTVAHDPAGGSHVSRQLATLRLASIRHARH